MHSIKYKNLGKKIVGKTHSVKHNGKDLLCKLSELTRALLHAPLIQSLSDVLYVVAPFGPGEWYCAFLVSGRLFSSKKLKFCIRDFLM